jgi:arylformamidase
MDKWIYLSYPISSELSGYGNGNRFKTKQTRSILQGDTSNNTEFCMPSHFGTHIDFPYHFSSIGKTIDAYKPSFFVFENVSIISLESISLIEDYLIKPEHLLDYMNSCSNNTELLLIKTGFCNKRNTEEYWKYGYGIGLGVAELIRKKFPKIRAVGVDLISLNSFQQREIGRIAHKEFLIENDILIVEDMDLSKINEKIEIRRAIIAPLNINGAEGAPVTTFANIKL